MPTVIQVGVWIILASSDKMLALSACSLLGIVSEGTERNSGETRFNPVLKSTKTKHVDHF